MNFKISHVKNLKLWLLFLIFVVAIFQRLPYFTAISKDVDSYKFAITDWIAGVNPYLRTIETYKVNAVPGDHGYAYLPGLLYTYGFLYLIGLVTHLPYQVLWKIPVLLADIGVGILLVKFFYKKSYLACVFALLYWLFNSYSMSRTGYTYFEPIPVFFMFLALLYLEKDEVMSGAFYALSIVFKTFPIVLLPLFLIKSKNRPKFLLAAFIVGLAFCIPFMTSVSNFLTFINGSVLVHGNRYIQGQPFLFYLSYHYDIELFQIIPLQFYSLMSMLFGWVLIFFGYFVLKIKDTFILSALSLLNFYLFTPVFNRTYFMWALPVFIIAAFNLYPEKSKFHKFGYYGILSVYWIFCYWYLVQWEDGFHITRP